VTLDLGLQVKGVEINYYFVCERKLWFFCHDMGMEHNSTLVEIGKEVHNESYQRERKEIMIDNIICMDFYEKELVINETKLTKSIEEATRYQLLYYLYYLENKGVKGLKGIIRYPKAKRTEELVLTREYKESINKVIEEISKIREMTVPPYAKRNRKCNKCSYFEFCFC
jgi:CRISPR-associated exonuclease Cas4